MYSIPTSTLSALPILSSSSSSRSSSCSLCRSPPSRPTEDNLLRLRDNGIVFHILSSVSLSRMRDLIAEALCICRRLRSRAVIGFELLLFDTGDADLLPLGLEDAELIFVDRRRKGPAACGTWVSRCCLTWTCAISAGRLAAT